MWFCLFCFAKVRIGRQIHSLIKVPFTKFQYKIKINDLLSESFTLCKEFARDVHSQCCYPLLQLRYVPISLTRIKGIQIGDHDIKIANFANGTTIFLREITCLNRIQVILKTMRQLVWRLLLRWKSALGWKTYPISMSSEIFSPY